MQHGTRLIIFNVLDVLVTMSHINSKLSIFHQKFPLYVNFPKSISRHLTMHIKQEQKPSNKLFRSQGYHKICFNYTINFLLIFNFFHYFSMTFFSHYKIFLVSSFNIKWAKKWSFHFSGAFFELLGNWGFLAVWLF